MNMSIILLLLVQVILIALNAVFASAEIAVLSINETKLEKMASEGNSKAKRLFKLTKEPAKFLASIQVAITLSGFLGSAFAADNFSEPLVNLILKTGVKIPAETLDTFAVIVITLVLSYLTLIFGELVPKRLAMKKSEQVAMGISGLVSGISVIFKPVVWFLSISTNVVLRLLRIDPNEVGEEVTEEEIRMLVDVGSQKGTIRCEEKELIQNVFEFNDVTVGEIATHRMDVDILWIEDNNDIWSRTIHESRHTRYPVCDDSPDKILGVLNAKDYFALKSLSKKEIMEKCVKPAYFVPKTIKADVLLKNMKKTGNYFAVVISEYGGMEGVITLFDLMEELVGDLGDESGTEIEEEPKVIQIDEKSWKIYGNIRLKDLEIQTGIKLLSEGYETFTGAVLDYLGVIPNDGEQELELKIDNFIVTIRNVRNHRIEEADIKEEI